MSLATRSRLQTRAVTPLTRFLASLNDMDPSPTNAPHACHGANATRMAQLKPACDPTALFKSPLGL